MEYLVKTAALELQAELLADVIEDELVKTADYNTIMAANRLGDHTGGIFAPTSAGGKGSGSKELARLIASAQEGGGVAESSNWRNRFADAPKKKAKRYIPGVRPRPKAPRAVAPKEVEKAVRRAVTTGGGGGDARLKEMARRAKKHTSKAPAKSTSRLLSALKKHYGKMGLGALAAGGLGYGAYRLASD